MQPKLRSAPPAIWLWISKITQESRSELFILAMIALLELLFPRSTAAVERSPSERAPFWGTKQGHRPQVTE